MADNRCPKGHENVTSENNNCIFPKCPNCGKGYLLPFSYKEDVFEKWRCSECGHTVNKR